MSQVGNSTSEDELRDKTNKAGAERAARDQDHPSVATGCWEKWGGREIILEGHQRVVFQN